MPEELKQLQIIIKPPPCFTVDRVFFSAYILLPPDIPLIRGLEKFHRLESPKLPQKLILDFKNIEADSFCAFGSVVVFVLKSGCVNVQRCALLCKLNAQCLLPLSLAAGLLQPLKVFFSTCLLQLI